MIGIVDVGAYSPACVQTAEEIAALSGIPLEVVRDRFGLTGKHIAAPDEHASNLAAKAAAPLLERNPGRPRRVEPCRHGPSCGRPSRSCWRQSFPPGMDWL